MAVDAARAKSLFLAASDLADPAERAAYLERACGGDVELRGRVEALLRANDAAPLPPVEAGDGTSAHVPDRPGPTEDYGDPTARVGAILAGKYKLIEEIGEGGMGSVYMAQQTEPVKRAVAVKVIKAGMDSKAVLTRFEAERQALAMMDHPNIAKVLDADATEGGRPFFVMELVKGLPITKFCDERKLTPRQRLELFVPVCQAIQHAHQKGVIHRDIKPSNVLVAMYDDRPVPKVIDFGVAKAAGQTLTDKTLMTGFGAVVGTPEYMSPEQANLNNLDIDTRSDVYSLGVLLYELLTGTTPVDRKSLGKAALLEILRIVREVDVPRPSAKLSTIDTLPSVAANRGTEPAKLSKLMKGELDWLVLKALEKDRTRRYETANGLARDIQRYLADEPVEARPPSAGYRLRKFLRRNKGPVLAASLVFLALLAGVIGTSIGMVRAANRAEGERLAKLDSEAQKAKVVEAAAAERQAHEQSQRRLAQIEKGNEIITSIFTDLDIRQVKGGTEPLEAVLALRLVKAARQLEGEAVGDPLAVAGLQNRLGLSLLSLGYQRDAIPLFVKARETRRARLGADHPDTLQSMHNLAKGYQDDSKPDLAVPLLEETLPLRKVKLGANHPDTLTTMSNLASAYYAVGKRDLALPLHEENLKLRKAALGTDHPDTLHSMNSLAVNYQGAARLDLAISLHEETLKLRKARLGTDHVDTLASMNNLASVYKEAGKLDLALPLLEETVKLKKAKLGAEHPDMLASMNNLALGYKEAGKVDLALPIFEATLKLMKAKLGDDHRTTFAGMMNLASSYQDNGKMDLAQPLYEEAMTRSKAKLGADHPFTLISMNNLAMFYQVAGKLNQALPLYEETLQLTKAKLGSDHPDTHLSMSNLGMGYRAVGKLDLALPLLEETLNLTKAKLGADHPSTLRSMNNLAVCYRDAGKLDLALPLLEETLKLRKAKLGADHPITLATMNNVALVYRLAGKQVLALPLLEETLKLIEAKLGADHPDTLWTKSNLGLAYQDAGKRDLALPLFQEAAAGIEKHRFQHQSAGQIVANLIAAHEQQEQFDRAETWRRKWLAVVKQRSGADSVAHAAELSALGLNLLQRKKWTAAELVLRECLAIFEKKQPQAWTTFDTQSMLGGALFGQKKYAEAEPLLLAGYEGLKQREKTIPPQGKVRIPEGLDRLIELHTATNRPDEVKKWQAERAKYPQTGPQTKETK